MEKILTKNQQRIANRKSAVRSAFEALGPTDSTVAFVQKNAAAYKVTEMTIYNDIKGAKKLGV